MIGEIARAAFRGFEWLKAADPRLRRENLRWRSAHPPRWPYPPPTHRVEVAGTAHLQWFEEGGRMGARALAAALETAGAPLTGFRSILDFGCGCGRVIRHLDLFPQARLHGCDINGRHVRWCRRHLPFAEFRRIEPVPPAPYPGGAFDLIYAFSVLTHLTSALQKHWMLEFRRLLAPGGCLAFSVHGARSASALDGPDRQAFDRGEPVVRFEKAQCSNLCNSYHPRPWVERELASGWLFAAFAAEGAWGNPHQDLYVLRKPE